MKRLIALAAIVLAAVLATGGHVGGECRPRHAHRTLLPLRADPLRRKGLRPLRVHERSARPQRLLRRLRGGLASLSRAERAARRRGHRRALLGTTRRKDGKLQVTYAGRPLYYYVGDRSPSEIRCQNVDEFGGLWLVARPNGTLVR